MVDFVPVDHDPFAPSLVPVDHDPFAAQAVDYDPFAAEKYVNPLVKGAIGGAADLIATPGSLANTPNPYPAGSEEHQFFEDSRSKAGQDWARDAALATMGTGAIAGVPVKAGEAVMGAGPIRAYHGSPHDFNAFDINKIGTGEGAQAYGHGLYFAEQPAVAEGYKNAISQAQLEKYHDELIRNGRSSRPEAPAGKMYEVQINADPEHFLDWDKPLTQQHPQTLDALKQAMGPNFDQFKSAKAGDAVRQGFFAPGEETTAARLSNAGIPGIKYLDQGSRAAGDGSRNYVVFDHNLVDIVRKYALAGVALPPAIKAAYDQMQQGQPKASGQPDYMAGLRK